MIQRLVLTAIVTGGLLAASGCASAEQPPTTTPLPSAPATVESVPPSEPEQQPTQSDSMDADALLDAVATALAGVRSSTTEGTITIHSDGDKSVTKISGVTDSSDPQRPKSKITMQLADQPVEVVMAGDDIYLHMALIGDQWLQMDRESMKAQGLDIPDNVNQGEQLAAFRGNVTKVALVGEEDVNGKPARHYSLTIDPKALGVSDIDGTPTDVKYDLWLNAQDLPVRFMFASVSNNGKKVTFEGVVKGYNEAVNVRIPRGSEIMPEE